MSTPFSTPSPRRQARARLVSAVAAVALWGAPTASAGAQHVVYDPRNHLENALQAARQLESLANEARSLARSPYSHIAENSRSVEQMLGLARSARGLAASIEGLEAQFADFYPETAAGDLEGLLRQADGRSANARKTAEDLARVAAELERLGQGSRGRLAGALGASETAAGQTAAIQSTNQLLATLAEDLTALRTLLLAQSRLLAEQAARTAADRAAGDAARRGRWAGGRAASPPSPTFDPLPRARN